MILHEYRLLEAVQRMEELLLVISLLQPKGTWIFDFYFIVPEHVCSVSVVASVIIPFF